MTLKLRDTNGVYTDSDPLTLSFKTNGSGHAPELQADWGTVAFVPEPAAPLALLIGAILAHHHRSAAQI